LPPVGKVTEFLEYVFLTEAQKKQMEDNADLIQEECISENADNSTEDPIEGGPDGDGDGEAMTDGIEEDFDEDGSNELVRNNHAMSVYTVAKHNHREPRIWVNNKDHSSTVIFCNKYLVPDSSYSSVS